METIINKDNVDYKIEVVDDTWGITDCECPRSEQNTEYLSKMIIHYRENVYKLPCEDDLTEEEMQEILNSEDFFALPLFIYEHGGLALSTSSQCQWDSSCVGIIYLSKDDVQQNGIENPIKILKDEIKEYDDYLQGNIFGIIISEKYKKVTIPYYQNIADKICNSDWEEIDSCYGFIGEDYAIQEHDSWVKHFEGEE